MLVSQQRDHGVDMSGDSDTETVGGASEVEDVGEVLEPTAVESESVGSCQSFCMPRRNEPH